MKSPKFKEGDIVKIVKNCLIDDKSWNKYIGKTGVIAGRGEWDGEIKHYKYPICIKGYENIWFENELESKEDNIKKLIDIIDKI